MVKPYIVFSRQCEEAMNFYERVFDAKNKEIMRYQNYVPEGIEEDVSNYVLHGKMDIFKTSFTFADDFSKPVTAGSMIHLTITPNSLAEGTRIYSELKQHGEVLLTPTDAVYTPLHTVVKDKFGVIWNIIVLID